jgi:hypothetical protein
MHEGATTTREMHRDLRSPFPFIPPHFPSRLGSTRIPIDSMSLTSILFASSGSSHHVLQVCSHLPGSTSLSLLDRGCWDCFKTVSHPSFQITDGNLVTSQLPCAFWGFPVFMIEALGTWTSFTCNGPSRFGLNFFVSPDFVFVKMRILMPSA